MIVIEILILVVTLVILVIVSTILHKINKEQFENCVGVQYNGLHFLENKKAPLFTRGYKSRYADGGLLVYDQDQAAIDYEKGRFTPAV
jgi:hypothetical protein